MLNEELINQAQRMLHDRVMYWKKKELRCVVDRSYRTADDARARADAYKSACDILLAAVQGNEECLRQFDYYGEEK